MEYVNNVHDRRWVDDDTPGARGYKYVEIVPDDSEYTSAFSCELMRLGPGDHSLTHVEDYNHLLFFLEGNGEITIGERTWPLSPGSYAKVEAGKEHSLRNHRDSEMLLLVVYDPPRVRDSGQYGEGLLDPFDPDDAELAPVVAAAHSKWVPPKSSTNPSPRS